MSGTDVQRCSACGAPLDAPLQDGTVRCAYCHAINVIRPQEKKRLDSIQCPKCGTVNPREAQHCGHCGFELKFNCPRCNTPNPYGVAYCLRCGIDIQAEIKRQEEAVRRAQEEAHLREEAMRRAQEEARLREEEIRLAQEEERRRQEKVARIEQEQAQRRRDERIKEEQRQARVTHSILFGIAGIFLILVIATLGNEMYKARFSPQARQTQTAVAVRETFILQTANAVHTAAKQTAVARQTTTARGTLVQQTIARRTAVVQQTISQQTAVAQQTILAQTATMEYSILFRDNFSLTSSGWDTYNSGTSTASYEFGGYRLQIATPYRMSWGIPPSTFQSDIRIDVDATKRGGPKDSFFGILCRYQDDDNFYFLAIRNDGYAAISRYLKGKYTVISSASGYWDNVTGIHSAPTANHIRADCIGNELTLYLNGVQVATATDDSFQTGEQVGLLAGTISAKGADILFDNFYVYRP